MLRIIQQTSSAAARSYYSTADYFTEGQELQGVWRGNGAEQLGLSGIIVQKDWDALCDNRHPQTGAQLTARQNQQRRVGWDFNFSVPKSVSLLYALTNDQRILDAFTDAVDQTMTSIESELQTRVRTKGRNVDRVTGNGVWGRYIHFTSRPVDGIPDPQLHAHCFLFNTTWDDKESRWKAAQIAGIKRDANYFSAIMHSRLTATLTEMGLPIERTAKSWRIGGIGAETEAKYSRRSQQIEAEAQRRGIVDPDEKAALGALTRDGKNKHLSMDELRRTWFSRLTPDEAEGIEQLHCGMRRPMPMPDSASHAKEAITHAIDHHLQREAVVPQRVLLTTALHHALGNATTESVHQALQDADLIRGEQNGRILVTSQIVLEEEQRMIRFARDGRNTIEPLAPGAPIPDWFNQGQRQAMAHLCNSPDRVMMLAGKAGTGKTTLLSELRQQIEQHGHRLCAFAPSADASRGVLREAGFADANTVSMLLCNPKIQENVRGQVILIDEAGQLSTLAMAKVFDFAEKLNARIILSGDRHQHRSVDRGEALRLLEQEAGIRSAAVTDIIRQKDRYKQATTYLSKGQVESGFRVLDELRWIHQIADPQTRYDRIAAEYLQAVESGKSIAVIAPTHTEGNQVTFAIRSALRQEGKIGPDAARILKLTNRNFTDAQKRDYVNYVNADVVLFTQNAPGYRKGTRLTVGIDPIPLHLADRFTVYQAGEISLASGDLVRITAGGATADGHRVSNGQVYQVKNIAKDGTLTLNNGWHLGPTWGQIDYGYCSTSHASQGKTLDKIIVAESSESYPAASREQFYVSVSRGRSACSIYTDDKIGLLEAVNTDSQRLSATELSAQQRQRVHRMLLHPALVPEHQREMMTHAR